MFQLENSFDRAIAAKGASLAVGDFVLVAGKSDHQHKMMGTVVMLNNTGTSAVVLFTGQRCFVTISVGNTAQYVEAEMPVCRAHEAKLRIACLQKYEHIRYAMALEALPENGDSRNSPTAI